jgi:ketosteroid isomerase-like protein
MSAAAQLRTALEARDLDAAVALLAPDVVFRSPIVHKPYHGPEAVRMLLEGILAIFEDFRYERVIGAPDAATMRSCSPPASATATSRAATSSTPTPTA